MKTESMGIRLPKKQEQEIAKLVEGGLYLSKGEFIREAIRDKLQSVEVFELRDISHDDAKKEICEFIARSGTVWTSDIANALRLDLDLVLSVLKELRHEGKVVEGDDS